MNLGSMHAGSRVMTLSSGHDAGTCEAAHPVGAAFGVMARHVPLPRADIGTLEPGFTPVNLLFADERFIAAMLDRQQASTPGLDAKGAAAYLVTEYAGLIGIAAAVPFLGAGAVPDFAPERCALFFSAGGRRSEAGDSGAPDVRLRLLDPGFATDRREAALHPAALELLDHDGLRVRLSLTLEAHFSPLIARLTAVTGLPRTAMWRLVGDAVAVRFLDAGQRLGMVEQAKADALAVLKRRGSPLANRQMHFFDITILEDEAPRRVLATRTFRARGGCCRYYTAEGGSLCSTCVLLDPDERDRKLEARMRRQLGLPATDAGQAGAHP